MTDAPALVGTDLQNLAFKLFAFADILNHGNDIDEFSGTIANGGGGRSGPDSMDNLMNIALLPLVVLAFAFDQLAEEVLALSNIVAVGDAFDTQTPEFVLGVTQHAAIRPIASTVFSSPILQRHANGSGLQQPTEFISAEPQEASVALALRYSLILAFVVGQTAVVA